MCLTHGDLGHRNVIVGRSGERWRINGVIDWETASTGSPLADIGSLFRYGDRHDAAFRRAGILRVSGLRELFDCAETLGRVEPPPGERLAILTNGGGIGVLAVDPSSPFTGGALLVLIADVVLPKDRRAALAWVTLAALGATNKMFWSETHRDTMNLAMDILGPYAQVLAGKVTDEDEYVPGYGRRHGRAPRHRNSAI